MAVVFVSEVAKKTEFFRHVARWGIVIVSRSKRVQASPFWQVKHYEYFHYFSKENTCRKNEWNKQLRQQNIVKSNTRYSWRCHFWTVVINPLFFHHHIEFEPYSLLCLIVIIDINSGFNSIDVDGYITTIHSSQWNDVSVGTEKYLVTNSHSTANEAIKASLWSL